MQGCRIRLYDAAAEGAPRGSAPNLRPACSGLVALVAVQSTTPLSIESIRTR